MLWPLMARRRVATRRVLLNCSKHDYVGIWGTRFKDLSQCRFLHIWIKPENCFVSSYKSIRQLTVRWWVHILIAKHPHSQLECGTWYHHPRRLQCVLSRNLRIFKAATWHYRCRHNLKNNCIWDNLQYCLLVPRSSSKSVMLTIDLQSRKVLFIEIVFWHV